MGKRIKEYKFQCRCTKEKKETFVKICEDMESNETDELNKLIDSFIKAHSSKSNRIISQKGKQSNYIPKIKR